MPESKAKLASIRMLSLLDKHIHIHGAEYIDYTFSFSSTSEEASGGREGQTAGFGQGSILRQALPKTCVKVTTLVKPTKACFALLK